MAEIAPTPASPLLDPRWPDLLQTLPNSCLQGLVAPPGGKALHRALSSRRNRKTVHPASPSPHEPVICAVVAGPALPSSSATPHGRRRRTIGGRVWRRGSLRGALRPHSSAFVACHPRRRKSKPQRRCFVVDDLEVDHSRRHPYAVGRLLVAHRTQVSAIVWRHSLHLPRYRHECRSNAVAFLNSPAHLLALDLLKSNFRDERRDSIAFGRSYISCKSKIPSTKAWNMLLPLKTFFSSFTS